MILVVCQSTQVSKKLNKRKQIARDVGSTSSNSRFLFACIQFLGDRLYKNSSADEIANVNVYTVRPEATGIRWNNTK